MSLSFPWWKESNQRKIKKETITSRFFHCSLIKRQCYCGFSICFSYLVIQKPNILRGKSSIPPNPINLINPGSDNLRPHKKGVKKISGRGVKNCEAITETIEKNKSYRSKWNRCSRSRVLLFVCKSYISSSMFSRCDLFHFSLFC